MEENILTISRLNAGYGKVQVLYDVSLGIRSGSITAIVGPNGSGKSTLLKTVVNLTDIYSGSMDFNGKQINRLRTYERIKLGIAYTPQIGNAFSRLTLRENLVLSGYLLSKEQRELRINQVFEVFPEIRRFAKRSVLGLSGGERQMLAMAMAIMRKPILLILDEPTANLAPRMAYTVFEKIVELNKTGITTLVVEQDVKNVLQMSDFAYLLVSGRVLYEGKAKELLQNPELGKLYLGIAA